MTPPDVASSLGRLAVPAVTSPFEEVRLTLLDAIVAAKVAGTLGQDAWQGAFENAARSLRLRVLADGDSVIRAAAAQSRYPKRRLQSLLPDADTADTLLHRLLAEGMALEQLEGLPDDAATRRARASALEQAWDGTLRLATEEAGRWRVLARAVAHWHRPTRPLWILLGVLLAVALILGAWLGGQLRAPEWFHPVIDWWWSLPWP